jgi:hypothetical protein
MRCDAVGSVLDGATLMLALPELAYRDLHYDHRYREGSGEYACEYWLDTRNASGFTSRSQRRSASRWCVPQEFLERLQPYPSDPADAVKAAVANDSERLCVAYVHTPELQRGVWIKAAGTLPENFLLIFKTSEPFTLERDWPRARLASHAANVFLYSELRGRCDALSACASDHPMGCLEYFEEFVRVMIAVSEAVAQLSAHRSGAYSAVRYSPHGVPETDVAAVSFLAEVHSRLGDS